MKKLKNIRFICFLLILLSLCLTVGCQDVGRGRKMITGEGHYVPSSALLADIKKLTRNQSQVLAIFSKELHEERYVQVRHVAKGLDLRKVNIPQDVMKKISLSNYISKRNNYLKRDGEKE